ncbi:hypothetical protein BGZ94_005467 [Podila epigama]|nr:hypothetical protein BGZ94_005467 [Podila epigama]
MVSDIKQQITVQEPSWPKDNLPSPQSPSSQQHIPYASCSSSSISNDDDSSINGTTGRSSCKAIAKAQRKEDTEEMKQLKKQLKHEKKLLAQERSILVKVAKQEAKILRKEVELQAKTLTKEMCQRAKDTLESAKRYMKDSLHDARDGAYRHGPVTPPPPPPPPPPAQPFRPRPQEHRQQQQQHTHNGQQVYARRTCGYSEGRRKRGEHANAPTSYHHATVSAILNERPLPPTPTSPHPTRGNYTYIPLSSSLFVQPPHPPSAPPAPPAVTSTSDPSLLQHPAARAQQVKQYHKLDKHLRREQKRRFKVEHHLHRQLEHLARRHRSHCTTSRQQQDHQSLPTRAINGAITMGLDILLRNTTSSSSQQQQQQQQQPQLAITGTPATSSSRPTPPRPPLTPAQPRHHNRCRPSSSTAQKIIGPLEPVLVYSMTSMTLHEPSAPAAPSPLPTFSSSSSSPTMTMTTTTAAVAHTSRSSPQGPSTHVARASLSTPPAGIPMATPRPDLELPSSEARRYSYDASGGSIRRSVYEVDEDMTIDEPPPSYEAATASRF